MTTTVDRAETEPTNADTADAIDTTSAPAELDLAELERFATEVANHQAGALAGVLAWIGDHLGLWPTLASSGPVTSTELAELTGLHERYLREWLGTMHATGYVTYDAASRRFHLPAERAAVLADPTSPAYQAGSYDSIVAFYTASDRVADSFRSGGGIPWGNHDLRLYKGVDRFFRPLYQASLVSEWLPALDGIVDRLRAGGRVLDVGCGAGSSTIIMAEQFPASTFLGVDHHEGSVERARVEAEQAGLTDRVAFDVTAATGDLGPGGYDLVCYFDAFHHVGDPVAAARAARAVLAEDGVLMLVEPKTTGRVEDDTDLVSLIYYASSTMVCVPDALAQGAGAHALGGSAGPDRLAAVLAEAGFSSVRVATEGPANIIIEARP